MKVAQVNYVFKVIGIVYKGYDMNRKREIAVKLLKQDKYINCLKKEFYFLKKLKGKFNINI